MTTTSNATGLVVIDGKAGPKVHKIICKRYNATAGHSFGADPADAQATPASCCKPAKAMADALAAGALAAVPDPQPEPEPEQAASTDRVQRLALAKAEGQALKQWRKGGEQGPKPATPNMDAIAAKVPAGVPGGKGKAKAERKPVSERAQKARAAKAKADGKRGAGVKQSDEQVAEWISRVLADNPEADHATERQFFYWVEGYTYDRKKFAALFADLQAKARKGAKAKAA